GRPSSNVLSFERRLMMAEPPDLTGRYIQLAGCGIGFIVAGGVFVFGEAPEPTLFWDVLFDIGHTALFAFVMWLALRVVQLTRPTATRRWTCAVAFVVTLMVAALSEGIQTFQPTRDPTMGDVLRDAAGALAVLLFRLGTRPDSGRRQVSPFHLAGFAVLLSVVAQLGVVAQVYFERNRAFRS